MQQVLISTLAADIQPVGTGSGIDHKRQIQFFFEFTESLNLLNLQFQGTESPVCLSILQIEAHRADRKQSARVFLDLHLSTGSGPARFLCEETMKMAEKIKDGDVDAVLQSTFSYAKANAFFQK